MFRIPRQPCADQSHGIQQQGGRSPGRAARRAAATAEFAASASARTSIRRSRMRRTTTSTCLRKVYSSADYVAVNVSSPNTSAAARAAGPRRPATNPGHALLEERRALQAALSGNACRCWSRSRRISTPEQISALGARMCALWQVDGVIATNTSTDLSVRSGRRRPPRTAGGLSGAPLHAMSVRVIAQLRAELGPSFPIIGVGGIVSADHARATLRAGANLLADLHGLRLPGTLRCSRKFMQGACPHD